MFQTSAFRMALKIVVWKPYQRQCRIRRLRTTPSFVMRSTLAFDWIRNCTTFRAFIREYNCKSEYRRRRWNRGTVWIVEALQKCVSAPHDKSLMRIKMKMCGCTLQRKTYKSEAPQFCVHPLLLRLRLPAKIKHFSEFQKIINFLLTFI